MKHIKAFSFIFLASLLICASTAFAFNGQLVGDGAIEQTESGYIIRGSGNVEFVGDLSTSAGYRVDIYALNALLRDNTGFATLANGIYTLYGPGTLGMINSAGFIFGPASSVQAANIIVSTLNISSADFFEGCQTGRFNFRGQGAYIINKGRLMPQPGGYVCLLSQAISNQDTIQAELGRAILATGEEITLSLDDANTMSVVIDKGVQAEIFGPDGGKMKDAIENTGTISANGGKVTLTAKVLNKVFDNAINNSGVIEAKYLQEKNGEIVLEAEGAAIINTGTIESGKITINAPDSDFVNAVAGKIIANGAAEKINGGYVSISALNITQAGVISANAYEGGTAGDIEIISDESAVLDENSTTSAACPDLFIGNGGRILLTSRRGSVIIRKNALIDISAGSVSGDGGFAKIGALDQVGFYGVLNGRAPPGYKHGKFLFDPWDITISGSIDADTDFYAQNDIIIGGDIFIADGYTLGLYADHNDDGSWHDGVGMIRRTGDFFIRGPNSHLILSAGHSIGTPVETINIEVATFTQELITGPYGDIFIYRVNAPDPIYYINGSGAPYVGSEGTYGIGSDTTGNGTLATPWATLTKAQTVANNGDTVYIAAGTYREAGVFTATKSITWIADGAVILQSNDATYVLQVTAGTPGPTFKVKVDNGVLVGSFSIDAESTKSKAVNLNNFSSTYYATFENVDVINPKVAGYAFYAFYSHMTFSFTNGHGWTLPTVAGAAWIYSGFNSTVGSLTFTTDGSVGAGAISIPAGYTSFATVTGGNLTVNGLSFTGTIGTNAYVFNITSPGTINIGTTTGNTFNVASNVAASSYNTTPNYIINSTSTGTVTIQNNTFGSSGTYLNPVPAYLVKSSGGALVISNNTVYANVGTTNAATNVSLLDYSGSALTASGNTFYKTGAATNWAVFQNSGTGTADINSNYFYVNEGTWIIRLTSTGAATVGGATAGLGNYFGTILTPLNPAPVYITIVDSAVTPLTFRNNTVYISSYTSNANSTVVKATGNLTSVQILDNIFNFTGTSYIYGGAYIDGSASISCDIDIKRNQITATENAGYTFFSIPSTAGTFNLEDNYIKIDGTNDAVYSYVISMTDSYAPVVKNNFIETLGTIQQDVFRMSPSEAFVGGGTAEITYNVILSRSPAGAIIYLGEDGSSGAGWDNKWSGSTIAYNNIYASGFFGIPATSQHGIAVGEQTSVYVHDNSIIGSYYGFVIKSNAQDWNHVGGVYNNKIISFTGAGVYNKGTVNLDIYNNTIISLSGEAPTFGHIYVSDYVSPHIGGQGTTVYNNMFGGNDGQRFLKLADANSIVNYSASNNTYWTYTGLNTQVYDYNGALYTGLANWIAVGKEAGSSTYASGVTVPVIASISNTNIGYYSSIVSSSDTRAIVVLNAGMLDKTTYLDGIFGTTNVTGKGTALGTANVVLSSFKRPFQSYTTVINSSGTTTLQATGLTGTVTFTSLPMDITPSAGTVTVSITTWNTSGLYDKNWTETASVTSSTVDHTIGNFEAAANFTITVDGTNTYKTANGSGQITFTYSNTDTSAHTFTAYASAASLAVSGITNPIIAGVSSNFTVTVKDSQGNTLTTYVGTIHFTSDDSQAVLPADYTFVSGDNGVHTFTNGVTLKTAGTKSVTATDTATSSITGAQSGITVNPSSIDHYVITTHTPQTAGAGWAETVTAKDSFGNTVTSDSATQVAMSSSGAAKFYTDNSYSTPQSSSQYTLSSGVFTAYVSDAAVQAITLTATDGNSKTGSSSNITVRLSSAITSISYLYYVIINYEDAHVSQNSVTPVFLSMSNGPSPFQFIPVTHMTIGSDDTVKLL